MFFYPLALLYISLSHLSDLSDLHFSVLFSCLPYIFPFVSASHFQSYFFISVFFLIKLTQFLSTICSFDLFFCCDFGNLWLMGLCKKIIALMTSCLKFFLSALMPHVIRNGWVGKPLFRNYKEKSMQNNWKNEVQTAIKTMAEYTWLDPLLLHVFKFKWFNKHHILYSSLYCYLLGVLLAWKKLLWWQ